MILEHAILTVTQGREAEFLQSFEQAQPIISTMSGFIDLTLHRGLEHPDQFLLLVRWETLEAHTVGFRDSAEYVEWKRLLHHFYEPFPTVTHFEI